MAVTLISDKLWLLIEPNLPAPNKSRRRRYPGRKPLARRKALTGILFVLRSGIPWEMLPQEMGCGSGMSCWRYLRDWQLAGGHLAKNPRSFFENRLHHMICFVMHNVHFVRGSKTFLCFH